MFLLQILCLTGTVLLVTKFIYCDNYNRAMDTLIMLAIPNSIIIVTVLIILVANNALSNLVEILLNGISGVLNLIASLLLLVSMKSLEPWFYVMFACTFCCSILMLVEVLRRCLSIWPKE